MHSINKKIFLYLSAFFLFFLSSVFITFPLLFHLGNYITGYGDELEMSWIHNWVIHSLLTSPLTLFEGNFYYPYHGTFAFQESLILTSIFALPIQLLMHGAPIVAVNVTYISSLTLLGFSVFLLTYYITKNYIASLLSGIIVVFSPAVFDQGGTLQIIAVEWIPLSILSFLHFIKTAKSKYLILSLLFFLFQMYNSFMPGYFIIISLGIIFLYNLLLNKKKVLKLITKKNILLVIISGLVILPVVLPYYQVSKTFHYSRDIRDTIHFALQPEDLLFSSQYSRLHTYLNTLPFNLQSQNNEFKQGYIGLVFSILCLFSLWYFFKHFNKKNIILNSLVIIAFTALILSFGPVLHLGRHTIHKPFPIILPYTFFYYVFPGFNGFRTPLRFEMLFIICMAVVSAIVLHMSLKQAYLKIKIMIYILLFAGILAEFNPPMHFLPISQMKDFPKVYTWLDTTMKDTAIIEMPIYNWNTFPYASIEQWRDYYSTANFRKTVNGYSGFSPPPWQVLVTNLIEYFPDQKTITTLKNMHITFIIVHKKEYDKMNHDKYKLNNHAVPSGNDIISSLKQNKTVTLVKQFGDDYVFTFVR